VSYAQPIFLPGRTYQVRESFESGPGFLFATDERLVFVRDFYSPYDGCFVYLFRREGTDATTQWWLHETQPVEVWNEYF
jgi:hypothetical protein